MVGVSFFYQSIFNVLSSQKFDVELTHVNTYISATCGRFPGGFFAGGNPVFHPSDSGFGGYNFHFG